MLQKIVYTIFGIGLAFIFLPKPIKDSVKQPSVAGVNTVQTEEALKPAPEMAVNLSAPILTAKAALAFDLDSGTILYSKNLDENLPIASLTKLMTALVVVKQKNLDDIVTVPWQAQGVPGSTIGLIRGERIRVRDLLSAMLIPSSNDAALALAYSITTDEGKFAELMNNEAKRLGLHSTNFSNPVGWDLGENYSNTLDLIKIVREFLKHPVLSEMVSVKETAIMSEDRKWVHQLRSTNRLLMEDPNVIGIKTGFTSKALGNLIILTKNQSNRIVTIVLGSDAREEDSQKLLDWAVRAYRW